jgi:hypothetical protein
VVVVYPREHYPVAVTPALILLAVQAWGLYGPRRMTWRVASLVALVLLCCMDWTRVRLLGRTFSAQRSIESAVRCAVQVDQTLPDEGAGVVSPVYIGMANVLGYLPHKRVGMDRWGDFDVWPDVEDWVRQKRPVLVELSDWKLGQMNVTPAEADQFMQKEMGYTRHSCGVGVEFKVYTKERP